MVFMASRTQQTERRADALSKERIVEAAIEILDADGEGALTFSALAARLATGSGAIYWHVADKNDLLAATTNTVISRVMTEVIPGAEPREAIRAIALGVFDAIDAHPWVGAQLSREPWQFTLKTTVSNNRNCSKIAWLVRRVTSGTPPDRLHSRADWKTCTSERTRSVLY